MACQANHSVLQTQEVSLAVGSSALLPDIKMLLSSGPVLVLRVSEENLDYVPLRPVSN